jgi:flagellar hook-associated protein 1 FlgK
MSGFSTLNTALTGLNAAQRAMDVTGQNVVNANTAGYSRQRVDLVTAGTTVAATRYTGNQPVLSGVSVEAITRIRDAFTEATRAASGARQSALSAQTTTLSNVEQLLSEPTGTGLQSTLDSFYAAWQDMSNNPTDAAAGAVVLQRGAAVTDKMHALAVGLADTWTTADTALANTIAQANQNASDLATLNTQIRASSIMGTPANDLMDRRDTLVRQLASLVGGSAQLAPDGTATVTVGGVTVVSGDTAQQLTLSGAADLGTAGTNPPTVLWGATPVSLGSGQAAGYLAALKTDLPALKTQLDSIAVALRDSVNSIHETGYTPGGTTGADFFGGSDALSLTVLPASSTDLAVAATPGTTDGSIAAAIGDLSSDSASAAALGGAPGPSVQWRSLTTAIGVQVQSLQSASAVQDAVVAAADDAVQSSAGVNMDEEMTNMLLYQRSYEASARVMTTVDSMLNTLINKMGG